jgi:hypothetical protein
MGRSATASAQIARQRELAGDIRVHTSAATHPQCRYFGRVFRFRGLALQAGGHWFESAEGSSSAAFTPSSISRFLPDGESARGFARAAEETGVDWRAVREIRRAADRPGVLRN